MKKFMLLALSIFSTTSYTSETEVKAHHRQMRVRIIPQTGPTKVDKLEFQGMGDKLYGNDGSIHHKDGSVTYAPKAIFYYEN